MNQGNSSGLVTMMSTKTFIYVASYDNHEITGSIYNAYYDKTLQFVNIHDMLSKLESLYDTLKFPQASMEFRKFKKSPDARKINIESGDMKMAEKEIKNTDNKATFAVHVQFRQNATWQGTINWVDMNKTQNFRSTLELIKLMDDALSSESSVKDISWGEKE